MGLTPREAFTGVVEFKTAGSLPTTQREAAHPELHSSTLFSCYDLFIISFFLPTMSYTGHTQYAYTHTNTTNNNNTRSC